MLRTLSKRFELSLSRRLGDPDWPLDQIAHWYGVPRYAPHGFGDNLTLATIFSGPVDPDTGMMINVSIIKERVNRILSSRYDHKFLNADTAPYDRVQPTIENLAVNLLGEIAPQFGDQSAKPCTVYLAASPKVAAVACGDGRVEREFTFSFSAARRTCSPHLSDTENERLFGIAARKSGHGHNYRCRVVLGGQIDPEFGAIVPQADIHSAVDEITGLLDHKNLNLDVAELNDRPITTESLALFLFECLSRKLPVKRVRLHELDNFFAECHGPAQVRLGMTGAFHAAHRLHSPRLTDTANLEVYAKCNNRAGHGHRYIAEATLQAPYDARSGTVYDFLQLRDGLERALAHYDYRHLDQETADFVDRPTTGENIADSLWPKLAINLDNRLVRQRLWETPNNRFTLRAVGA